MTRGVSGFLALVSHWASSSRPLCFGLDLRSVRDIEHGEEAARHDRPELLRLAADADFRVADRSCASRTPRATGPLAAGSVRASRSLCSRSSSAGRPPAWVARRARRVLALRLAANAPRTRPWPRPGPFLASSIFSAASGPGRSSDPSGRSMVGVVVVQAAAAHLVPHAGAQVGAVEDAGQGVVVGRRDRVELVVVAAGAARPSGPGPPG